MKAIDDVTLMERINAGRRVNMAAEVFMAEIELFKQSAIANLIGAYREGKIDQLAVAKLVALEDLGLAVRRKVDDGERAAKALFDKQQGEHNDPTSTN